MSTDLRVPVESVVGGVAAATRPAPEPPLLMGGLEVPGEPRGGRIRLGALHPTHQLLTPEGAWLNHLSCKKTT
jgi:hypothetical protein